MSTARNTPEHGNRAQNYWFIREAQNGERIVDPDWQVFSNNASEFTWSPDPNTTRQDGLGIPHAVNHFNGTEGHELTFNYDLQRPLIDTAGNRDDPSVDALLRNDWGELANTHAVFSYEERPPAPDDPADTAGARTYTIAKGGHPDVSTEPEIEEGQPMPMEMTYTFEKVRSYAFYQPAADTELGIASTSADDTTQDITLENEAGDVTETVTLNGTTTVWTTATFGDLFTAHLSAETDGDVSIYYNAGTSTSPAEGTELTITPIHGALHYSNDEQPKEGDLGVPAIGAGSAGAPLATDVYEHFESARVEWGTTGFLEPDLISFSLETGNDWSQEARQGSVRYRVTEGNAETQATVESIGPDASHEHLGRTIGNENHPLEIELSRSLIRLNRASIVDSAERSRSDDGSVASVESTLEPAGENAIDVENMEA